MMSLDYAYIALRRSKPAPLWFPINFHRPQILAFPYQYLFPFSRIFITTSNVLLLPVPLLLLRLLLSGIDHLFTAWQHCTQGVHILGPGTPQPPDEVATAAAISQMRKLRLTVLTQCAEIYLRVGVVAVQPGCAWVTGQPSLHSFPTSELKVWEHLLRSALWVVPSFPPQLNPWRRKSAQDPSYFLWINPRCRIAKSKAMLPLTCCQIAPLSTTRHVPIYTLTSGGGSPHTWQ